MEQTGKLLPSACLNNSLLSSGRVMHSKPLEALHAPPLMLSAPEGFCWSNGTVSAAIELTSCRPTLLKPCLSCWRTQPVEDSNESKAYCPKGIMCWAASGLASCRKQPRITLTISIQFCLAWWRSSGAATSGEASQLPELVDPKLLEGTTVNFSLSLIRLAWMLQHAEVLLPMAGEIQADLNCHTAGVSDSHAWGLMLPSSSRVSPVTYHSVVAVRYPDLCRFINGQSELGSFASPTQYRLPEQTFLSRWSHGRY